MPGAYRGAPPPAREPLAATNRVAVLRPDLAEQVDDAALATMTRTSGAAYAALVTNVLCAVVFGASAWRWNIWGDAEWGGPAFGLAALACVVGAFGAGSANRGFVLVAVLGVIPTCLAGEAVTRVATHFASTHVFPVGLSGAALMGVGIVAVTIWAFFETRVTAAARREMKRRRLAAHVLT